MEKLLHSLSEFFLFPSSNSPVKFEISRTSVLDFFVLKKVLRVKILVCINSFYIQEGTCVYDENGCFQVTHFHETPS